MKKRNLLGPQHRVALAFLHTIFKDNDAVAFWSLISSEAQGFFKGHWYSKGFFTLEQLRTISFDNFFIREQLNSVLAQIRQEWGKDICEYGVSNRIIYDDQFHAQVKFICNPEQEVEIFSPTVVKAITVPLVYELTIEIEAPNPAWKVDYLNFNID
ncbi:MAG: hypothetical protein FH756_08310 [Firmicutes bacterium]|nr:hypothetical protein [Bacillota bacterium]